MTALTDAAITACALMIKGICLTKPQDKWVSLIKDRIRFMLEGSSTAVPTQPTEAMLNATRDWSVKKYGQGIGNDAAIGCWQAMLAVSPAAPAQSEPVATLQFVGYYWWGKDNRQKFCGCYDTLDKETSDRAQKVYAAERTPGYPDSMPDMAIAAPPAQAAVTDEQWEELRLIARTYNQNGFPKYACEWLAKTLPATQPATGANHE